jgi:Putative peptidoglycan binding domain
MKTSILSLFALTISAALAIPVQAGGHGGGGGIGFSGGGGHTASAAHVAGPSFRALPGTGFRGSRFMAPGQRFSSVGMRSPSSTAFRQHYINSNGPASIGARQFTPGHSNRANHLTRLENNPCLAQGWNRFGRGNGAIESHRNGASQVRHGNNLPTNWRNHVVAQHSGNWHRDWDRGSDHWWHGHHCRFINGSWVIFDFGFYPWWPYGYPYDYYAYDYYPSSYSYDPGYYDSGVYQGEEYYDQNGYDSSDQSTDPTVAAAQEQLAGQGYYRGEIDGIFGAETRRAIMRYQSGQGLRVIGNLNTDTLHALGLPRVASN